MLYERSDAWLKELGTLVVGTSPAVDWRETRSLHRGNFRPVDWALRRAELAFGEPTPRSGHLVSLVVHALAAAAAAVAALRLWGGLAGLLGGLAVAINPVGSQALTFVASRGDALVGLFSALVLVAATGSGFGRGRAVCAGLGTGLFAALSLGSKVTGFPILIVPFLALVFLPQRRTPWYVAPCLAVIAVMLFVRYRWLATWLPLDYRGFDAPPLSPFDLAAKVGSALDILRSMAVPSFDLEGFGASRPVLHWLASASAALALIGALKRPKQAIPLLVWFAAACAPALMAWLPASPLTYDRILYPATVPFGILIGGGISFLLRGSTVARLTAWSLICSFGLCWIYGHWCFQAVERLCVADREVKRRAIAQVLEENDFVVLDLPSLAFGQFLPIDYFGPRMFVSDRRFWKHLAEFSDGPTAFARSRGLAEGLAVERRLPSQLTTAVKRLWTKPDQVEFRLGTGNVVPSFVVLELEPGDDIEFVAAFKHAERQVHHQEFKVVAGRETRRELFTRPSFAASPDALPATVSLFARGPGIESVLIRPMVPAVKAAEWPSDPPSWHDSTIELGRIPPGAVVFRATVFSDPYGGPVRNYTALDVYWLTPSMTEGETELDLVQFTKTVPSLERAFVAKAFAETKQPLVAVVTIYYPDHYLRAGLRRD